MEDGSQIAWTTPLTLMTKAAVSIAWARVMAAGGRGHPSRCLMTKAGMSTSAGRVLSARCPEGRPAMAGGRVGGGALRGAVGEEVRQRVL